MLFRQISTLLTVVVFAFSCGGKDNETILPDTQDSVLQDLPADLSADIPEDLATPPNTLTPPAVVHQSFTVFLATDATMGAPGQLFHLSGRIGRGEPSGTVTWSWTLDGGVAEGGVLDSEALAVSFASEEYYRVSVTATDDIGKQATSGVLLAVVKPESVGAIGDIDDNGIVEQADVDLFDDHTHGSALLTADEFRRADVDLDNRITANDRLLLEETVKEGWDSPRYLWPTQGSVGTRVRLMHSELLSPGAVALVVFGNNETLVPVRALAGYATFVVPPGQTQPGEISLKLTMNGQDVDDFPFTILPPTTSSAKPGEKLGKGLQKAGVLLQQFETMVATYTTTLDLPESERAIVQGMLSVSTASYTAGIDVFLATFDVLEPSAKAGMEMVALANGLDDLLVSIEALELSLTSVQGLPSGPWFIDPVQAQAMIEVLCAANQLTEVAEMVSEVAAIAAAYLAWFDTWPEEDLPILGQVVHSLLDLATQTTAVVEIAQLVADYLPELTGVSVSCDAAHLDDGFSTSCSAGISISLTSSLCSDAASIGTGGILARLQAKLVNKIAGGIPLAGYAFEAAGFMDEKIDTLEALIVDAVKQFTAQVLDKFDIAGLLENLADTVCTMTDAPVLDLATDVLESSCGSFEGTSWTCDSECFGDMSISAQALVCGEEISGSFDLVCTGCGVSNCTGCCDGVDCVPPADQNDEWCGAPGQLCTQCDEYSQCDSDGCSCTSDCSTPGKTECSDDVVMICTPVSSTPPCNKLLLSEPCLEPDVCIEGKCDNPCGPASCDGCCLEDGTCMDGTTSDFCGLGGESCVMCGDAPMGCNGGTCACIPVCDGLECGDDSCDGSCGECVDPYCSDGQFFPGSLCTDGACLSQGETISCEDDNPCTENGCDVTGCLLTVLPDDAAGTENCGVAVCNHTVNLCADGEPVVCDPLEGAEVESCDGIDNDCDSLSDEDFTDSDADGQADCVDDDDDNDLVPDDDDNCPLVVNPEQEDADDDDIGDACDGDMDGDGSPDEEDCNPADATIYPGAMEVCNGKDNDCNDTVDDGFPDTNSDGTADCVDDDDDGDGVIDLDDCEPLDLNIFPGQTEKCNDLDDNCDEFVDESFADKGSSCSVGLGICLASGEKVCSVDGLGLECNAVPKPKFAEVCNDLDDNCDGIPDNGENLSGCITYYRDADDDGYGLANDFKCLCSPASDYTTEDSSDCDDGNEATNPLASESCMTAQDDNCNGTTNDVGALGCIAYYMDFDNDTYGAPADSKCMCEGEGKYSASLNSDCNDIDESVHPNATETCNNVDDDCNNLVDDDSPSGCSVYYLDFDNDGHGNPGDAKCLCVATPPYSVATGNDCNDDDSLVNPDQVEICNNEKDDNCSGGQDEGIDKSGCLSFYLDADEDGYGSVIVPPVCYCKQTGQFTAKDATDCNDELFAVHPGADEICDNAIDDNCNSMMDEENAIGCEPFYYDNDGDKYGIVDNSKCLCFAQNPDTGPYGAPAPGDCADTDWAVNPGVTEACNGKDDNCANGVDEEDAVGCEPWYADKDGDEIGADDDFKCLCSPDATYYLSEGGDCDDNDPVVNPETKEICDNEKDDDCSGEENDGMWPTGCKVYYPDSDKDGYPEEESIPQCLCSPEGIYTVPEGFEFADCDDENPDVHPFAAELCDNDIDDNCNWEVDEEDGVGCKTYYFDYDSDGYGVDEDFKCLCASQQPPADHCCIRQDTPGCEDAEVQACVCGFDSFCCEEEWDSMCVNEAKSDCLLDCDDITLYRALEAGDCEPGAAEVNPGEKEVCSGEPYDENCNGQYEEEGAEYCSNYYPDADGDGFGDENDSKCLCNSTPIYKLSEGGDCDDNNEEINPEMIEICGNAVDEDCSGAANDGEGDPGSGSGCMLYFADVDEDGYGDMFDALCLCEAWAQYKLDDASDCDDDNAQANPDKLELCTTPFDDNCDGLINESGASDCINNYLDQDNDLYGQTEEVICRCEVGADQYTAFLPGDCDDGDGGFLINPGATESCNEKDDDCDDAIDEEDATGCNNWYADADNDWFGADDNFKCLCSSTDTYNYESGGDCDDNNKDVNPEAVEVCDNEIDDDCSGEDGDGWDPVGCSYYFVDDDNDGYGYGDPMCLCSPDEKFKTEDSSDCNDSNPDIHPNADEICNSEDDNCNDVIDEGC
jgi:hypothetical protein